jgi:predicted alpha/beta hydrolase family esterase
MTNYFIVPGLGGSGANHWQTHFEKSAANFQRIQQKNWNAPDINEWAENIEKAISGYDPESVILVGHSFGCLTISAWSNRYNKKIKGALLVAPPDIELIREKTGIILPEKITTSKLNFPTLLVASTTDYWAGIESAESYAKSWGSEFVNIGDAGHINDLSGHGEWKQGLKILYSFGKKVD